MAFETAKPRDWQDFQRACVILYQAELGDPHAQEYGRSGQDQGGIDILARRNGDPDHLVGIQCRLVKAPLKLAKIRADCAAAIESSLPLKELIFATTAPDDTHATKAAYAVEQELRAKGYDIFVALYGWEQLQNRIAKHASAHCAFNPLLYAGMAQYGGIPSFTANVGSDDSERFRLKSTLIEQGGEGLVQIGPLLVDIQPGAKFTITAGEVDGADIAEAVRAVLSEITASQQDRAVQAYLQAVKKLDCWGYVSTRRTRRGQRPLLSLPLRLAGKPEDDGRLRSDALLAHAQLIGSGTSIWLSGTAGSGKTTLLRHIARSAWFDPAAVGLVDRRIPLYIKLPAFVRASGVHLSARMAEALNLSRTITTPEAVPDDFLERWSASLGKPWLFLLDGFDEVHHSERQALREELISLVEAGHNIVVTSRPNAGADDFDHPLVRSYTLCELDEDDRLALSDALLGERSGAFRAELARINAEPIRTSPLLFTLAAQIFEKKEALPTRRIELYKAVTEDWIARLQESSADQAHGMQQFLLLGEALIGELALVMSRHPDATRVEDLVPMVAESLQRFGLNASYFKVPDIGANALRLLGETSSVFEVAEGFCGWLHPSFREYFAARALSGRGNEDPVVGEAVTMASDASWRQIVIMLASILQGDQTEQLLERLVAQGPDGLTVAGLCLKDGAEVSPRLECKIIAEIAAHAVTDADESYCSVLLGGSQYGLTRLNIIKSVMSRPIAQPSIVWLRRALLERVQASEKPVGGHAGWGPQWFSFLGDIGGDAELCSIVDENRNPSDVRAQALHALASCDPERAVARLKPIVDCCGRERELANLLIRTAFALEQVFIARDLMAGSCLTYQESDDLIQVFGELHRNALEREFALSPPPFPVACAFWHRLRGLGEAEAANFMPTLRAAVREDRERFEDITPLRGAMAGERYCDLLLDWKGKGWSEDAAALLAIGSRDNSLFAGLHNLAERLQQAELADWHRGGWFSRSCSIILLEALLRLHWEDEAWIAEIERFCANGDVELASQHDEALAYYVQARLAFRRDDTQRGKDLLTRAVEATRPSEADGVSFETNGNWLGLELLARIIWLDEGDPQSVLPLLDDRLARIPDDGAAHRLRGFIRFVLGDTEGVVEDLEYALTQTFDHETLAKLAEAYRQKGYFSRADECCSSVIPYSEVWRFMCLQNRGAARVVTDWDGALEDLNAALALDPDCTFALLRRAYLLRNANDAAAALADVTAYIGLVGDDPEANALAHELIQLWGGNSELILPALEQDIRAFLDYCAGVASEETARTEIVDCIGAIPWDLSDIRDEVYLARMALYLTLWTDLGDLSACLTQCVKHGGLLNLIEIVLPLARKLRDKYPHHAKNARCMIDMIEASAAGYGGNLRFERDGPPRPKDDYTFPMYCAKVAIGGLEKQRDYCDAIFRRETGLGDRAIVMIRLDDERRIYGQCNFKRQIEDPFKFKFCDTITTTFAENIVKFVRDMRVRQLVFVEPDLKAEADRYLRGGNLPVALLLVDTL